MYIKSITVINYKSYLTSPELELTPGFNYIVGQNDAGKTALLEAISLNFTNKPHRNAQTIPHRSSSFLEQSSVNIAYALDRSELLEAIGNTKGSGVSIPIGQADNEQDSAARAQTFIDAIVDDNTFRATYTPEWFTHGALNRYAPDSEAAHSYKQVVWNGREFMIGSGRTTNPQHTFLSAIGSYVRSRTYVFRAERAKIGRSSFGSATRLEPDASNLPVVINSLQGNPTRFARLNHYMRQIFPHIDHVSALARPDSSVELFVWPTGIGERDDLAIPLSESGTGIGQVLALIYVLLTSEQPQAIVIDEPQSFLHPGASRKLVELLNNHPQHQFILATHSPSVLSPVIASTITLVRKIGSESIFESLNIREQQDLQRFLLEVGARPSDVFGADSVLWVEGKTEELCYPLIIRYLLKRPLMGTVILGVSSTGDFESKHTSLVLEIYQRLSSGGGMLPPAIGFIFDGEDRKQTERVDLKRRSGGTIHFLPRRMYENYLLNPSAITAVLNAYSESSIAESQVTEWIDKNRWDSQYFTRHAATGRTDDGSWAVKLDGARLLKNLFGDLTGESVAFNKVSHSTELTEWIIEHSPADLAEVSELLAEVLKAGVPR
jgi:predicted ATPase